MIIKVVGTGLGRKWAVKWSQGKTGLAGGVAAITLTCYLGWLLTLITDVLKMTFSKIFQILDTFLSHIDFDRKNQFLYKNQ